MLLDVYVVYLMQILLVLDASFFGVIVMEKCVVSRGVERSFISVNDFGRWIFVA
jgi:hypothetical protein